METSQVTFGGIKIVTSEYLPKTRRVQFRFPRSKKKRIQKKWRKNAANWHEVDATGDIYMISPGFMKLPQLPSGLFDYIEEYKANMEKALMVGPELFSVFRDCQTATSIKAQIQDTIKEKH